jgi:hypothetical protein
MLPKFRSFVRPIIRSFVRSFIVSIHRSSFVHTDYSPSLFTFTIHHYYSPFLFIIVTIYRCYSSMISMATFSSSLFIVAIQRSSDHPKFQLLIRHAPSPPKTSQTNISVIRTPVTVIFLQVGTSHLVTHPSFSKLSTLNFEIPLNQASKLRFQILVSKLLSNYSLSNHVTP